MMDISYSALQRAQVDAMCEVMAPMMQDRIEMNGTMLVCFCMSLLSTDCAEDAMDALEDEDDFEALLRSAQSFRMGWLSRQGYEEARNANRAD